MKKLQELIEAKAKILSESKDDNVMNVSVPFIQSDVKNRNGRIYKKSLLQREIARVQGSVKKGSFIGAGDHPQGGIENIATASHIVTKLSLDEKGKGTAELRILPTERGKTIQTLIRNDAQLGVSVRGFGEVGRDGIVSDSYKLVGLDIVTNPSFKDSVFDKSNIFESQNFEEEANENLEKEIQALEKESYLGACESGYKGSQEDWEKQYSNSLREAMGLPKAEGGKTSVEKLTEEQISARTYGYYQEAVTAGFKGTFPEWKEKFPQIVEQASEVKVVVEKKAEPKAPIKLRTNWNEIVQSGFHGSMDEFKKQHPDIQIIPIESPQKPIVETLEDEAQKIFSALKKDNPNSQLTLESVIQMLEKEGEGKRARKERALAAFRVSISLAGDTQGISERQLEKMVEEELEIIREQKAEKKRKNWEAYKRLLSD